MHSDRGSDRRLWDMVDRMKINQRIACPEAGYPASEARFLSTKEWEEYTGKSWNSFVNNGHNQSKFYV